MSIGHYRFDKVPEVISAFNSITALFVPLRKKIRNAAPSQEAHQSTCYGTYMPAGGNRTCTGVTTNETPVQKTAGNSQYYKHKYGPIFQKKRSHQIMLRTSPMAFLKVSFGRAPIAIWGIPSIGMKSKLGMLCMPNIADNSLSSSVFTL